MLAMTDNLSMIENLYFLLLQSNNSKSYKLQIFTADGKEFTGIPTFYNGILCISETDNDTSKVVYIDPFHVKIAKVIWN